MRFAIWLVVLGSAVGCYGNNSLGEGKDSTVVESREVQQELMDRWNRSVGALPPGSGTWDFHWTKFDKFPHPTYQAEGEASGYAEFARILLLFLEDDENFDYLSSQHLFEAGLRYEFPSGDGDTWTFRGLVDFFVDEGWGVDAETRDDLAVVAARIDEAS
jgi:hypothetical protein